VSGCSRRKPLAGLSRLVAAIGVLAPFLFPAAAQTQGVSDEYRLKAAFVYRFPQFIEWPAAALADTATLDICVLRPNPFGADLEELVRGESIAGRPIRVREITQAENITGCHAVFAPRGDNSEAILKAAAGRPVLTIGETDAFLDAGGIIALKVIDRRVRFDVNTANAEKVGLRLDAQLLSLAASVRRGPL
jgi:YfiR/HmsC-like